MKCRQFLRRVLCLQFIMLKFSTYKNYIDLSNLQTTIDCLLNHVFPTAPWTYIELNLLNIEMDCKYYQQFKTDVSEEANIFWSIHILWDCPHSLDEQ